MTRLIQRIACFAAAAALVFTISGQASAMPSDEPGKAGAATDKKDEKKDATPAADSKAPDGKPSDAKPDAKPADKKSDLDFRNGYKQAYDAIYKRQDYSGALVILTALGHDEHPDVANLIGFASRKLGRTEDARIWYEKALAADPKHTRTWQYYGMWHLERGDRAKAEQHLERVRLICGEGCEEFTSLRDALNGNVTY
ncbi:tetratricopeptide repeat protein [Pseudorhodoplanes sp.]|uniref:tetratricopeptide repeat protein n=1 Tax=Pseudorhodoplanes sp. TaxID=1934341 RepID=UPI002B71555A|nr:tetratricopeptide repeat protein [Pseudorhodoplanes sp.]HWV41564.1 tetratricopeptide repeat protein [Pseudorhodoplanes sp.]